MGTHLADYSGSNGEGSLPSLVERKLFTRYRADQARGFKKVLYCRLMVPCKLDVQAGRMEIEADYVSLAICATAGSTFCFCSFWIYHYIDLEDSEDRSQELYLITAVTSNDLR